MDKKKLQQVNIKVTENGYIVEGVFRLMDKEDWNTEEKEFVFQQLDEAVACATQILEMR